MNKIPEKTPSMTPDSMAIFYKSFSNKHLKDVNHGYTIRCWRWLLLAGLSCCCWVSLCGSGLAHCLLWLARILNQKRMLIAEAGRPGGEAVKVVAGLIDKARLSVSKAAISIKAFFFDLAGAWGGMTPRNRPGL